jgi:hypothetical protein
MSGASPDLVISVIGIDPGQTTGIAFVDYIGSVIRGKTILQVDGGSATIVLEAMLARYYNGGAVEKRFASIEPFVTGQGAGSRSPEGEITRQLAFQLGEQLQTWGYFVKRRKAADVKPWATDKVLKAAGVFGPPEMRHANDGARQALYAAVHDAYRPSPLR